MGNYVTAAIAGELVGLGCSLGKAALRLAPESLPDQSDRYDVAWTSIHLVLLAANGAFFLTWLRRASGNLRALGIEEQRFYPAWAVGCWFIPLLNLIHPFRVVREVWQKSKAVGENAAPAPASAGSTSVLSWWWACCVTGSVLRVLALQTGLCEATGARAHTTSNSVEVAALVLLMVGGLLLRRIVRSITAWQQTGYESHLRVQKDVGAARRM